MLPAGSTERAFALGCVVNGGLAAAVGGLMCGLPGLQLGLVAGLLIPVLPMTFRGVWAWLARRDGLPLFLATHVSVQAVAAGQAVVVASGSLLRPVRALMRPPALAAGFLADLLANTVADQLGRLWGIVATPLGLANLIALAVIAANLAGVAFAALAALLALGMLLLVLIVSESEAAADRASNQEPRDG